MDNLDRINAKIEEIKKELYDNGYYEDFTNDPTTFKLENHNNGAVVLISMNEMNIEGYFYLKFLAIKGKWKKEYKQVSKLLKAVETHFEDDIRDGKINTLLDEI